MAWTRHLNKFPSHVTFVPELLAIMITLLSVLVFQGSGGKSRKGIILPHQVLPWEKEPWPAGTTSDDIWLAEYKYPNDRQEQMAFVKDLLFARGM